jgi:glycosyltransferase involved in cell wall biosynthesis
MRIVHLTPGSGDSFYCENCLRDKASVLALRRAGHDALMVPLYLPPLGELEGTGRSEIFFGGVNVYLQQKSALFRRTPRWMDRMLDSPRLLRAVGRMAGMTSSRDLAETTLSMLRGPAGRQVKELQRLVGFLAEGERPAAVVLSNALLAGLAGPIRRDVGAPVVCILQDEDGFLDALDDEARPLAWAALAEAAGEIDLFAPVSRYYADVMTERLGLPPDRVRVLRPGIDTDGYRPADAPPDPPAVGYLSRTCRDKGLDLLVDAFIRLRSSGRHGRLRLRISGGRTSQDKALLTEIDRRLRAEGLAGEVDMLGEFDDEAKRAFLPTLSVMSVPERKGEAASMYLLEALAAGVPFVQPANGAAVEVAEGTGGGLLCRPEDAADLAEKLDKLLSDPDRARSLGAAGRKAVLEQFSAERMAADLADLCRLANERFGGRDGQTR